MKGFRLTIAQRLWLGLGILLALFGAADLVSLRATHVLDETLSDLVGDNDARNASAYELNGHLDAMNRAVESYLQERSLQQRDRAKDAQAKFERGLASYRSLASTERSRSLAKQASEGYARYKRQAQELMRQKDAQASALTAYDAHLRSAQALVQDMPQVVWASREAPPIQKRIAAEALSASLLTQAKGFRGHLPDTSGELDQQIAEDWRAFDAAFARYRMLAQTAAERDWALAVEQWHAQGARQLSAIIDADTARQRGLRNLARLRRGLEDLLEEGIAPAQKAELKAAMDKASGTAHRANVLITRGLLLALVLGVLIALATGRAVKAPLRALVASSRKLAEGDFSHRVPAHARDEIGELTGAFNEMADRLQATTVSRSYMESVVSSMGEALLVLAQGSIKTANPVAEQLLGYEPGALIGKPLESILASPAQALNDNWRNVPSRFRSEFTTREGARIPVFVSAVPMAAYGAAGPAIVCIAQDLRERLAAEQGQRQASVVFENTREGIALTDAERNIVMVNPAFSDITGYALDEVEGRTIRTLWSERHDGAFWTAVWQTVEKLGQWQGEIWMRRKDGEIRPVWKNMSVVRDGAGRIVNHVLVFSDITAIKHAEERLHYLAYHDPLTDLPNRLLLADRLRSALNRAELSGTSLALLYLDIDNFKHVNDTLGHEEGDRLLQAMAGRLLSCVRGKDGVARLGGDEFVVILEDDSDPGHAARVAEKVLAAISAPLQLSGLELRMRASIGISLSPTHGSTADELLKAADAAMYRAKRGGRGRYEFFSAELTRQAMERLTLENALRHPHLLDQLIVHYQPQVSVASGRMVGAEALVRWRHPSGALLAPQDFIPMAEEAGLIQTIGEWVLSTACAQAKAWRDDALAPIRMAVNISAYQIRSDTIVDTVESALQRTGLDPALLELEVTEGAVQTGQEATDVLGQLKQLGVRLALDDFGTGYSALSSLKLLPFDRLKIDRAFVQDLQTDANARALAKAIIAMGRSLNLDILAEGVETPSQLAFLREEGCDEMQGYLIGVPMTADELAMALRTQAERAPERARGFEGYRIEVS